MPDGFDPDFPAPPSKRKAAALDPDFGGGASTAVAEPDDPAFKSWYAQGVAKARSAGIELDPNPDSPEHQYDYRAAFKAGVPGPDDTGHWPSTFKREGNPRTYLRLNAEGQEDPNGVLTDTRTMKPAARIDPLTGEVAAEVPFAPPPLPAERTAGPSLSAAPGFKTRGPGDTRLDEAARYDLLKADALTGQHNADNPEFRKAFETGGSLDTAKTAAYLSKIQKAHGEALPAWLALSAHAGRTVASGTTLGFWKGGLSKAEDELVSANPAVQGPAGSVVGAAGTVLAAANPVGPVAALTRFGKAAGMGRAAGAFGFGTATGIEHRSVEAGLEAAAFAGGAGAAGRFLGGEAPGALRRFGSEALGVGGTSAAMSMAKDEPLDWRSILAQAGFFGLTAAGRVSPLSGRGGTEVDPTRGPPTPLTMAQKAHLAMAEAVGAAVPEAAPEQVVAFLKGDLAALPPDMAVKMGLAAQPALEAHRKAVAEAEVPPAERWALTQEAAKAGVPAATLIDKARKPVDVSAVPEATEPVPAAPGATGEAVSEATPPVKAGLDQDFDSALAERGAAAPPVDTTAPDYVAPDSVFGEERARQAEIAKWRAEGAAKADAEAAARAAPVESPAPIPVPTETSAAPKPVFRGPKKAASAEGKGLAELVRKAGGIDPDKTNLKGEIDRLRTKDSGTTRVVRAPGNGNSIQRLMESVAEDGYDVSGMSETDFVSALIDDVSPTGRKKSAAQKKADAMGVSAAELAQRAADPEAAARYDAERRAEDAYAAAERAGMRDDDGGDQSFDVSSFDTPEIGDAVTGTTREGERVTGEVVRETGRSLVLDDGSRVPKDSAAVEPSGAEQMGLVDKPKRGRKRASERGAVSVPSKEDLKRVGRAIVKPVVEANRWLQMRTAPNISKENKTAGDLAGTLVNSHTTSSLVAPLWAEQVFGKDVAPEVKQRFTDAAVEFNLQTLRADAEKAVADAPNDIARLSAQARLDAIKTHIGEAGFAFKDKKEWSDYWSGPEAAKFKQAHRDLWQGKTPLVEGFPSPEEMFRYLTERGVQTDDLISTDPRDEMRFNMVGLRDYEGNLTPAGEREAERKAGKDRVFGSASSPENIRPKPHPYAREFTGTAQEYLRDYDALVENTYRRVLDRYAQAKMTAALEAGRDLVEVKDGQDAPEKIKGEKAVRLDPEAFPRAKIIKDGAQVATAPGSHYYARESFVPELKQLLRMNDSVEPSKVAGALNAASLFGLADNAWNLALDTMITGSAPGTGLRSKGGLATGVMNNLVATLRLLGQAAWTPAGAKAQNLRLSKIGAFRSARTPEWTAASFLADLKSNGWTGGLTNVPFKAFGRLSARVHEAGRRILDDAYTALSKIDPKHYPADSDSSRREFINRLGQYAGRGMGKWTQRARDSGVFPFVTAQRKGAAEVVRKVTLSGGGANGTGAYIRLAQATKILSVGVLIGLWNTMKTNDPRGRPGVPFGAMDLGYDDEHGNPMYSDLAGDLTGVRQTLIATGARAAFTAQRRDLTAGQTADAVAASLANSWLVKFVSSPTTGFLWRMGTGKNPYYGSRAGTVESPGESEQPGNLKFAATEAFQPARTVLSSVGLQREEDPGFSDEVGNLFPNFAPRRGARDVATLRERIAHHQADDRADYMVGQFRNMTTDQRLAWIKAEMPKWSPSERRSNLARLMRNARRP